MYLLYLFRIGSLLGAPIVGLLAETRFGYIPSHLHIEHINEELRVNNAWALGHSLLCLTSIPWTASFFIYGFSHLTLKYDKVKKTINNKESLNVIFVYFGILSKRVNE